MYKTFADRLVSIRPRDYLVWYLKNRDAIKEIDTDDLFEETIKQYFIDKGVKEIIVDDFAETSGMLYIEIGVQRASTDMPKWIVLFWDGLAYENSALLNDAQVIISLVDLIQYV